MKDKKLISIKKKKNEKGNFFFKKFFFKTLLKCRKNIKNYFFLNKKTRQKKLTKFIFSEVKLKGSYNSAIEYTVLNLLLRSQLFFFLRDVLFFIKQGYIYINSIATYNNKTMQVGDCIQIPIFKKFYKYYKRCKKFFKKKTKLNRYNY